MPQRARACGKPAADPNPHGTPPQPTNPARKRQSADRAHRRGRPGRPPSPIVLESVCKPYVQETGEDLTRWQFLFIDGSPSQRELTIEGTMKALLGERFVVKEMPMSDEDHGKESS
jgi:hypothetical protein